MADHLPEWIGRLIERVEATGRHRYLAGPPGSFWWEVRVDGIVGWVNARFLAWLGATDDGSRAGAVELALEGLFLAQRISKDSGEGETVYG